MWLYMSPLNDMFFYAGQMWLLYLVILLNKYLYGEKEKTRTLNLLIAASILLAIITVHFRLNIIFVPIAGIISAIFIRKYRLIPLMLILFVAMTMSLASSYLIVDRYDFHLNTCHIGSFFCDFRGLLDRLLFDHLPASLFFNLNRAGNLLYIPFYLSLMIAFIHGLRQKNLYLLMIFFICCMTFLMTLLHGAVTYRYLWAVTIFMYMLLMRVKEFRAIGILFVAAVLINTILPINTLLSRWEYKSSQVLAWENISKETALRRGDTVMLSLNKRPCWYFTGIPSVYEEEYTWETLDAAETIFIIGPRGYVDGHLEVIKGLANLGHRKIYIRHIDYGIDWPDLLLYEVSFQSFSLPCDKLSKVDTEKSNTETIP